MANMLAKHRTQPYQKDPFCLDYKALKIGEFFEFRVLSLDEDQTCVIPCRKVTIINPRDQKPMTVPIHDPGYEACERLSDQAGKPLTECQMTNIYRIPVWALGKGDMSGNFEEINELKYLEFGEGIKNSFFELEDEQAGMFAFLEGETGRPEYEIRLIVIPGPSAVISKNYKIEGVYFDSKTKKPRATFGVTTEEVLKAHTKTIEDNWESLMGAMTKTEGTFEEAQKRLRGSTKSDTPAMSNRPSMSAPDTTPETEETHQEPAVAGGGGPNRYRFNANKR